MAIFLDPNNQGGGIKQLESDEGSGVYLKSDNSQGYVSFKDQTINNGNEVKLSEFALKSELSNVDLTNYQGDWDLSVNKTVYSVPITYSFSTTKTVPSGEGEGLTEPLMVLQTVITEESLKASGGLALSLYTPYLYMVEGATFEDVLQGNVPQGTEYDAYIIVPGHMAFESVTSEGKHSAGINVHKSILLSVDSLGTKFAIKIGQSKSNNGIFFTDPTIQSTEFTLKSLVDRIATLETQVSELQTQLAAKANTNSPTFTGKVTINSITE